MTKFQVNLPRVDLHPEMFEALIAQRGMPISWEKAQMCSCVRADNTSGRPSFNCGICYNGNVYIDKQNLTAVITNITGQRNAQIFGELAIGGIFVTVPGNIRLGVNDRLTLLNQTARYSELVVPESKISTADANPGDTTLSLKDTRKFPVPTTTPAQVLVNGQTLTYTGKTTNSITGIPASGDGAITTLIASGSTVQAMEWSLRYAPISVFDARTTAGPLTAGVDFELVDTQRIRLLNANGLPRLTVLYDSTPVYLVDSLSHEFRDQMQQLGYPLGSLQFTRLPVAAACRRDFINRLG